MEKNNISYEDKQDSQKPDYIIPDKSMIMAKATVIALSIVLPTVLVIFVILLLVK